PLTTLALSSIPRHRLADGTGLNSLLRQVGGSVGLAVFATLLTRFATRSRGELLAAINNASSGATARWGALNAALRARGADPVSAQAMSARAIDGLVRQQAMVLAFEKL